LTTLEELNLRLTKISDANLLAISTSLTRLTKLDLQSCRSITAAGFACLSSLTSLEDLDVCNTEINDEGLRAISTSLTRLTKLNLTACHSITGAGFACLSSLTLLQDLNVRETEINDEGLRVIASLPAIHTLDLRGCRNVSAEVVASLSIANIVR